MNQIWIWIKYEYIWLRPISVSHWIWDLIKYIHLSEVELEFQQYGRNIERYSRGIYENYLLAVICRKRPAFLIWVRHYIKYFTYIFSLILTTFPQSHFHFMDEDPDVRNILKKIISLLFSFDLCLTPLKMDETIHIKQKKTNKMYMNYNLNDQVRLVNNECFGIFLLTSFDYFFMSFLQL